MKFGEVRSQQ